MSDTQKYQKLFDDFVRSNKLDEDDSTWPDDMTAKWQQIYEENFGSK